MKHPKRIPSAIQPIPAAQRDSRVDEYIREAADLEAARFKEAWEPIKDRCESPIEALLMASLYAASKISEYRLDFFLSDNPNPVPYLDQCAYVYQQVPVGPYRVDIIIHDVSMPLSLAPPRWMVVECDGHDFHERTKEQARHDKKRDRFFQSKGYKVLRFTGSEIWADPDRCAEEIIDELAANDSWRNHDK